MDHGHSSCQAQQWPSPGQMRYRVQDVGYRSSQGAWVSVPHGRPVALGQGGDTQQRTELAHSSAPCRVEGVLVPGL